MSCGFFIDSAICGQCEVYGTRRNMPERRRYDFPAFPGNSGRGICLKEMQFLGHAERQDMQPMQLGWRTKSVLATSIFMGHDLLHSLLIKQIYKQNDWTATNAIVRDNHIEVKLAFDHRYNFC